MATTTGGISFTGLASGLDTNALIDAMLKVDQARVDHAVDESGQGWSRIVGLGSHAALRVKTLLM